MTSLRTSGNGHCTGTGSLQSYGAVDGARVHAIKRCTGRFSLVRASTARSPAHATSRQAGRSLGLSELRARTLDYASLGKNSGRESREDGGELLILGYKLLSES